jgi:hypothetical protein
MKAIESPRTCSCLRNRTIIWRARSYHVAVFKVASRSTALFSHGSAGRCEPYRDVKLSQQLQRMTPRFLKKTEILVRKQERRSYVLEGFHIRRRGGKGTICGKQMLICQSSTGFQFGLCSCCMVLLQGSEGLYRRMDALSRNGRYHQGWLS